jgi:hypothetical protein
MLLGYNSYNKKAILLAWDEEGVARYIAICMKCQHVKVEQDDPIGLL